MMHVNASRDWTTSYYQYANRLATLHFLRREQIGARLLLIYFVGDDFTGKKCPKDAQEWRPKLRIVHDALGLTGKSDLERFVHEVFVPVDIAPDVT